MNVLHGILHSVLGFTAFVAVEGFVQSFHQTCHFLVVSKLPR